MRSSQERGDDFSPSLDSKIKAGEDFFGDENLA
jgi:hypothetical protein